MFGVHKPLGHRQKFSAHRLLHGLLLVVFCSGQNTRHQRSVTGVARTTEKDPLAVAIHAKVDMDDANALIQEARASIMEVRKVHKPGLIGIAEIISPLVCQALI